MGRVPDADRPKAIKLTPKQVKIVKTKVEAELKDIPQRVWAPKIYPDATPQSAEVLVSRELKKVNVQDALQESFAKLGLTTDTLTATVASAIAANKTVPIEGDLFETEVPDHSIRLKAAGMAAQWMGVGKGEAPTNLNFINISRSDKGEYGL